MGPDDLYSLWIAIQFFWGALGPVNTGVPPSVGKTVEETLATQLTQAILESNKVTLASYLVTI